MRAGDDDGAGDEAQTIVHTDLKSCFPEEKPRNKSGQLIHIPLIPSRALGCWCSEKPPVQIIPTGGALAPVLQCTTASDHEGMSAWDPNRSSRAQGGDPDPSPHRQSEYWGRRNVHANFSQHRCWAQQVGVLHHERLLIWKGEIVGFTAKSVPQALESKFK